MEPHYFTFSELYTMDYTLTDLFAMRQTWRAGTLFSREVPRKTNGIILLCGASGKYTDLKTGRSFVAHPGHVICLPEGSTYSVLNLTDGGDVPDAYLVEFRLFYKNTCLLLGSAPFLIPEINTYLLREASEKAVRSYEAAIASPARLRADIYSILTYLGESALRRYDSRFESIARGIEFLEANPFDPISIEQVAAMCPVSPVTFRRLFKEYAGKTPTDYRLDLKLDAAKRMIDSENASFSYISEVLGFDSPAYFSRFFKQRTGLSPRAYRERASRSDQR